MKKCTLLVLACSILLFRYPAFGNKNDIMKFDGTDWNGFSDSVRIGYIVGVLTGIDLGIESAEIIKSVYDVEKKASSRISTILKIFLDETNNFNVGHITAGQLKEGIDTFYNDFANKRIKIIDTLLVVKLQIQGKNPDYINTQTRYLRMMPIKPQNELLSKYIKDKNSLTKEELLQIGYYRDEAGQDLSLFCYGNYESN